MSSKRKEKAQILSHKEIAPDIFDMKLKTSLAKDAGAGRFVGVYPQDKSKLLPRPISICEVDNGEEWIRLVYRIAGEGTREFSRLGEGDSIDLLGVLGNGFPVSQAKGKKVALIGGGIGIPPMLQLAKEISDSGENGIKTADDIHIIVGYRDSITFLKEDLSRYGTVHIASEDGSVGTKGNVLTILQQEMFVQDPPEIIMACGPLPMLKALKEYSELHSHDDGLACKQGAAYEHKHGIKTYISLEEHMACGVGACLGCVCKTSKIDHHSGVHNARICTDGPVFDAQEVEL